MESASPYFAAAVHRIDTLVEIGVSFTRLERVVQAALGVDEDERAALWLYAFTRSGQARLGADAPALAVTAAD